MILSLQLATVTPAYRVTQAMTKDNFIRLIQSVNRRRPWKPYTLELLSGSRVEVNHPEALQADGELWVCSSTTGLRTVFECSAIVRFIYTTGVS